MKPTILVAGGAGYIGSHIVRLMLQQNDFTPVILDNLSTGHRCSIPEGVAFEQVDVRDTDKVYDVLVKHKIQAVIHLCAASLVGESVQKPLKYFDNNCIGAISLLEAMEKAGVDKLIFSSTAATYGQPDCEKITETTSQEPINPYGRSKLIIEQMINWLPSLHSIAFRYFNVAGAGLGVGEMHDCETHLIPCLIKCQMAGKPATIFGDDYKTRDGTCVRDYIHVLDLAEAHLLGLKRLLGNKQAELHEAFNLGTKNGLSVKEIVQEVQKNLPLDVKMGPRRPGDPDTLVADSTKAEKVLGWKPQYGVADIIASAIKFHLQEEAALRALEK